MIPYQSPQPCLSLSGMAASHVNTSFASEAHRLHYEDQVACYAKQYTLKIPHPLQPLTHPSNLVAKASSSPSPTSPYGDFATLPNHTWSPATKQHWASHNSLPTKLSDLPNSTTLVTYTYHVPQSRSATGTCTSRRPTSNASRLRPRPRRCCGR